MNRDKLYDHTIQRIPSWASDHVLLMGLRGSDAHGTKLPPGHENSTDDVDVFVVSVQDMEYYLSLEGYSKKREHWDTEGEDVDILVYDIRKFINLLYGSNPNVVSWLWNREEDYLWGTLRDTYAEHLINSKKLFISKELLKKLFGYAMGQKERMLKQNKYAGYMGEKRKLLVDKYGYDVKFAQHCLRLLYTGIEVSKHGTAWSYRPSHERSTLKQMKEGRFSFDTTMRMIDLAIEEFKDEELKAILPDKVNYDAVNSLLYYILTEG